MSNGHALRFDSGQNFLFSHHERYHFKFRSTPVFCGSIGNVLTKSMSNEGPGEEKSAAVRRTVGQSNHKPAAMNAFNAGYSKTNKSVRLAGVPSDSSTGSTSGASHAGSGTVAPTGNAAAGHVGVSGEVTIHLSHAASVPLSITTKVVPPKPQPGTASLANIRAQLSSKAPKSGTPPPKRGPTYSFFKGHGRGVAPSEADTASHSPANRHRIVDTQ